MHQADEQGPPGDTLGVCMVMKALFTGQRITAMAVRVQVDLSVVMAMGMLVDLVPQQAPQDVDSKDRQHDSDGKFQRRS